MKAYLLNSHLNNFTIVGFMFSDIKRITKDNCEFGKVTIISKYLEAIPVEVTIPSDILHASMCKFKKGDYVQVVGMIRSKKINNEIKMQLIVEDIKLLQKSRFTKITADNFANVVKGFDKGKKITWNANAKTAKKEH